MLINKKIDPCLYRLELVQLKKFPQIVGIDVVGYLVSFVPKSTSSNPMSDIYLSMPMSLLGISFKMIRKNSFKFSQMYDLPNVIKIII